MELFWGYLYPYCSTFFTFFTLLFSIFNFIFREREKHVSPRRVFLLDHFFKLILQRPENQLEGCQLFDTWHVTVAIYDSYLEFTYGRNGLAFTKVLPIYRGFLRNNLRHYCCFEIERLKSIRVDP